MTDTVRAYQADDAEAWDTLVHSAINGTFLHSRRFLAYHGDRFTDASKVISDPKGRIIAVFPAALKPGEPHIVTSHPGITYGGLVHDGSVGGARMLRALEGVVESYRSDGLQVLQYKAVPVVYHRRPAADDLYALFRIGASRSRCDLSSAISLNTDPVMTKGRRSDLARAARSGVQVVEDPSQVDHFWPLLERVLKERHGAAPVHSITEVKQLLALFPDNMSIVVGMVEREVVAGALMFLMDAVAHTQYLAADERGHQVSALDAVIHHAIRAAKEQGRHYFDFGVSTENGGRRLNEGLHNYKKSFGSGGVVHEFFDIWLTGQ